MLFSLLPFNKNVLSSMLRYDFFTDGMYIFEVKGIFVKMLLPLKRFQYMWTRVLPIKKYIPAKSKLQDNYKKGDHIFLSLNFLCLGHILWKIRGKGFWQNFVPTLGFVPMFTYDSVYLCTAFHILIIKWMCQNLLPF